jgi:vanillin dehydrogenase
MASDQGLLIAGEQQESSTGETYDDVNPYTGDAIATIAAAAPADVTRAVDAAAAAFKTWSQASPAERRAVFLRAAQLVRERTNDVITALTPETGATFGWGMFMVTLAEGMFLEAAAAATAPVGEVNATNDPGALSLTIRRPAGVVAAFSPWNAPTYLSARAVGVPLAVGNTVVLKATEEAPISAGFFIAGLLRDAGLPAGVLNVITTPPANAEAVSRTLIDDPRVRRVNFTGSTRVGRKISEMAGKAMKRAVLELGGKNSLIVLADADLDYAVSAAAFSSWINGGQVCMSGDRIIVAGDIAEEFAERLAQRAEGLRTGDPADPQTVIGPLISASAANRVAGLVDEAVKAGAKVRSGGGEPDGAVYRPTVLSSVNPSMRISNDEIFGPVCTIHPFDTPAEAVAIANDTTYGLSAAVISEDIPLAMRVAGEIDTGLVHINGPTVDDEPMAAFGGVGDSGFGRFGGQDALREFTEPRWVKQWDRSLRQFPI